MSSACGRAVRPCARENATNGVVWHGEPSRTRPLKAGFFEIADDGTRVALAARSAVGLRTFEEWTLDRSAPMRKGHIMMELDEAIGQVENLYRAVTGKEFQTADKPYAPIPAERDPAAHVKEQMDRLLSALSEPSSQVAMHASANLRPWSPPISLCETAADILICIDVPGVTRERLDVRVDQNCLVVTGQRPVSAPTTVANGHRPRVIAEQPFGAFRREVLLPFGLKTSEMSAQLKEGVLVVRIPRSSDASSRTVPIA